MLLPATQGQASAGAPSVTVSSWPMVSRPNSTGMKAPTATTRIEPKKIVGDPVCGTIRAGTKPLAKSLPNDSPKICQRPRNAVVRARRPCEFFLSFGAEEPERGTAAGQETLRPCHDP